MLLMSLHCNLTAFICPIGNLVAKVRLVNAIVLRVKENEEEVKQRMKSRFNLFRFKANQYDVFSTFLFLPNIKKYHK